MIAEKSNLFRDKAQSKRMEREIESKCGLTRAKRKRKALDARGNSVHIPAQFDMLRTENEIEACEYCGAGNYTYHPFGCYKPQPPKKSE